MKVASILSATSCCFLREYWSKNKWIQQLLSMILLQILKRSERYLVTHERQFWLVDESDVRGGSDASCFWEANARASKGVSERHTLGHPRDCLRQIGRDFYTPLLGIRRPSQAFGPRRTGCKVNYKSTFRHSILKSISAFTIFSDFKEARFCSMLINFQGKNHR